MNVISVWQPFSTLLVKGIKVFETRTWAPPKSLIGQRIGIAATKKIVPAQRQHFADDTFQSYYSNHDLPDRLEDAPLGYLLGIATLDSYELVTEEFLADVSHEEQQYGWFDLGNYAWRMTQPFELPRPIPIRGTQGIYKFAGPVNDIYAR